MGVDDYIPPDSEPPSRRPRAPTITVDTPDPPAAPESDSSAETAVAPAASSSAPPSPTITTTTATTAAPGRDDDRTSATNSSGNRRPRVPALQTDLLSNPESGSGRPRSSSPPLPQGNNNNNPSQGNNFLCVPAARSRGNSVDSEHPSQSDYGGDTYVPSSHSAASQDPELTIERDHDDGDRIHDHDAGKAVAHDIVNDPDALRPDPGSEPDFVVDDNHFAFSPGQLNKLINPKSLAAFYALGGLGGLEHGLRTSRSTGLSADEGVLDGSISFDDAVHGADRPPSSPLKAAASSSLPPPLSGPGGSGNHDGGGAGSFVDRKRVFGDNRLPQRKIKSIWELAWIAYNDKVLILLTIAAIVSLALGIYQSIAATDGEARVQWVEGVAIIVAILIVVIVGAVNDYQKELQFLKLNKKKDDRLVKLVRSGKSVEISIHDILAGDVLHLEPGDLIPADGIFIDGHNVRCDESSATGESDLLRKSAADDVFRAIRAGTSHRQLANMDPFILSGAKVSEGIGTFLVTATGVHSSHGKMMMSLQDEGQTTPLQSKLNVLAEYIAKLGLASGLILFVVLFIKFLVDLHKMSDPAEKGQNFLQIFIVAVTIIVVAVPEGLPLAVTLALAFATTRMLKDNNLVRLLRACETMGNATTICSDKTGTLTQNKMSIVAGTMGRTSRFGSQDKLLEDGRDGEGAAVSDHDITPNECLDSLTPLVKRLLRQSIVQNSTAFEGEEDGMPTFIGSKTESALLDFGRTFLGMGPVGQERANAELAQMFPFDSSRKCMAVVLRLSNGKYRLLVKGAAEILLSHCTRILQETAATSGGNGGSGAAKQNNNNDDDDSGLESTPMSDQIHDSVSRMITHYASCSLRTIALVWRDFEQWPPRGCPTQEEDQRLAQFEPVFRDLTMLGVVGLQDPLRPGVSHAVEQCQGAGVFVRMVTGDNLLTAKSIATECGVFTAGGIAMEGPQFRRLTRTQMNQIIPRLQVLARSSPEDKKILVTNLIRLGETVAVTGDGTNDAPALKKADVGFSMGIAGTEVAKEASDIIVMDDNFASLVRAIAWGRTVNDAVRKFLQFQITVNITAVILTFVSAVASGRESSVLTAVQLLWVNLIMDTFAALALATDSPTSTVLDRRPSPKSAPLISLTMWKMIVVECAYQLAITFVLNFAGKGILHYGNSSMDNRRFQTIVFNTFVWMQVFNQYNCRRVDNNFNIFEGMLRNYWFLGIQLIIIGGQVLIVFVGGRAFSVTRINGVAWAVSLVLGFISIPVGVIARLIPDELIRKSIPASWRARAARAGGSQSTNTDQDDEHEDLRRYQFPSAIEEIRDQLSFLKTVRGGRLRNLKYKLAHPHSLLPRSRAASLSDSNPSRPLSPGIKPDDEPPHDMSLPPQLQQHQQHYHNHNHNHPQKHSAPSSPLPPATPDSRRPPRSRSSSLFGTATVAAGIVAGSVGGWSPLDRQQNHHGHNHQQQQQHHQGDSTGGGNWLDSAPFTPSAHHSGLDHRPGIEIHPDTLEDDPIVADGQQLNRHIPPSQDPELAPQLLYPRRGRSDAGSSRSARSGTNSLGPQNPRQQHLSPSPSRSSVPSIRRSRSQGSRVSHVSRASRMSQSSGKGEAHQAAKDIAA